MLELLTLPDGISLTSALLMGFVTGFTSFISGVLGIGGGTILLGFLAVLLPPVALVPIHAVLQLGSNSFRALLLARYVNYFILMPFAVGSMLGSVLSGAVLIQLPMWMMQMGIALFIVWSVFGSVPTFGRKHIVLAGGFSGFLTMLFGATGPFVSAFVKSLGLSRLEHIGTNSSMMVLQHTAKIAVFSVIGFSFGPYAALLVGLLVCGMIGTAVGRAVLLRIDETMFRKILNIVLIVLAGRLLWTAIKTLLQESNFFL
jgi:uncharacterized membrane protein YfcA